MIQREEDTDPPPSKLEVAIESAHEKIDGLILDVRGARMWRTRVDGVLKDQTDRMDRVEGAVLQVLAITKDIGAGMRDTVATAQRAERLARAAETKSDRGSWADDLARDAARSHLKNVSEEERLGIELAAKKRATKLKILYALAVALIGSLGGALTHVLMR